MLRELVERFTALPSARTLWDNLPSRGTEVGVDGLPGSGASVMVAALSELLQQRVVLVVAATPADAERWHEDLRVLVGDVVALYPQREALGEEEPHFEIAGERVETIEAVLRGRVRVVVTTLRATVELTRMAAVVVERA